ncbi:hypothetical protein IHE45_13G092300 [Dioscorea alata]|uniref:Uncharacterized protein n=1 Tax=Dioscorea alata TaxID=55571 RepID=A0ACB7UZQ3_DIOAL|nr:hypothetical protein IHE45_13G092300 [Dioscorea alata]
MPLLVDEEKSVGEDAFVWLASLLPVVADVVNARFAFEAMTASTLNRLHFPAYDRYLKEIHKCIEYLQKQAPPTGFELADDEFILHIEGTARTQRVVRHIGGTSWPGRLTLTNLALYFEASGVISYETALKIDLSKPDLNHQVKPASTGPWGAPLFDKAITYESSSEPVVLEFPEMTSSIRRDLWLTLVKEVILLHQFISSFKITSPTQGWEMQARTGLGVFRLHAARELLRISPPSPTSFLIFSLFDELPKGDYVLEELCNSLKQMDSLHPCSAASILKSLNMTHPIDVSKTSVEAKECISEQTSSQAESLATLDMTVNQAREEAKEVRVAKATVESMKEEGIADSLLILAELLSPLRDLLPWLQNILTWKRPAITVFVLVVSLIVIYEEWVGIALAVCVMSLVGMMIRARRERISNNRQEIVVSTSSDKTTVETIVAAQHSLRSVHDMVKNTNITLLKIRAILESRAPKQAIQVMLALTALAMVLVVIPFKFILMLSVITTFAVTLNAGKSTSSSQGQGHRRFREWWESIPIVPVRTINT